MRFWDRLASEVPADHMVLDYTLFYGGEPAVVTPNDLIAAWQPLIDGMTATQHVLSYDRPNCWFVEILADLDRVEFK